MNMGGGTPGTLFPFLVHWSLVLLGLLYLGLLHISLRKLTRHLVHLRAQAKVQAVIIQQLRTYGQSYFLAINAYMSTVAARNDVLYSTEQSSHHQPIQFERKEIRRKFLALY